LNFRIFGTLYIKRKIGLGFKNIDFNMSYDINTSNLKQFTNGKGAFEFSIIFKGTIKNIANSLL
jgi:hypothetical protein